MSASKMLLSDLYRSPHPQLPPLRSPVTDKSVDAEVGAAGAGATAAATPTLATTIARNTMTSGVALPTTSSSTISSTISASVFATLPDCSASGSRAAHAAAGLDSIGPLLAPGKTDWFGPHADPDLVSRDKVKQKKAIRRYLDDLVQHNWEFVYNHENDRIKPDHSSDLPWDGLDPADSDAEGSTVSAYSAMSDDSAHYRPRAEWTSDLSDAEADVESEAVAFRNSLAQPTRFRLSSDIPYDAAAVAAMAPTHTQSGRDRRRRAIRRETRWNEGLACFEARRDAWTGATTVRVRPSSKAEQAVASSLVAALSMSCFSPLSPRRLFSRQPHHQPDLCSLQSDDAMLSTSIPTDRLNMTKYRSITNPSPTVYQLDRSASPPEYAPHLFNGRDGHPGTHPLLVPPHDDSNRFSATVSATSNPAATYMPPEDYLPVETLIPVPRPLLPPANSMRASIKPTVYMSIYDKVVLNSLTPSCPVNLVDMVRSCVEGWKRDGEWLPRTSNPVTATTALSPNGAPASNNTTGEGKATTAGSSRRLSFGFLGRGERDAKDLVDLQEATAGRGGVRRSVQRALGLGLGLGQHSTLS